jgi:hypothetical protein
MTRKVIILAGFAALGIMSIASMAPAKMSSTQLGSTSGATTGYPLKLDTLAELEANRSVKGAYCGFMRRSQACPNSPWDGGR